MRLVDADALKKAIETYDKFAYLPDGKLCPFRDLEDSEMYVPYIHFDDVIKAIDNTPTVNPCENCDLYFMAKTKEEMRKGGAV